MPYVPRKAQKHHKNTNCKITNLEKKKITRAKGQDLKPILHKE